MVELNPWCPDIFGLYSLSQNASCKWTSVRSRRPPRQNRRLFPPPAPGERRHRSLARRLGLWGAALPLERQYLASLLSRLWDLLAKDYAAACPDASSFDLPISARR